MPACMEEHQLLPASQAALWIRKGVGLEMFFFFLTSALYLIIY